MDRIKIFSEHIMNLLILLSYEILRQVVIRLSKALTERSEIYGESITSSKMTEVLPILIVTVQ